MQTVFRYHLRDEMLFCKHCSSVNTHKVFARQNFKNTPTLPPDECLLSVCPSCQNSQTLFAGDLRVFCPQDDSEFTCKIAGRGRIVLDDWVYIPGHARPGKVQSRFRKDNKEVFVLSFEDGNTRNLVMPPPQSAGKEAMARYKLLPYQIAHTLIGDHVYHVGRDQIGHAVGFIRSNENKLLIQLEDSTFLIMSLPGTRNRVMPNDTLKQTVEQALSQGSAHKLKQLEIRADQGIIYINGTVHHLMERESIIRFIESLEFVRAVIPALTVSPQVKVSDSDLEQKIHHDLFNSNQGIFGIELEVNRTVARITGYIQNSQTRQQIKNLLSQVDGLSDFVLNLTLQENPSYSDMERTRQVLMALKKNSALDRCQIRVSTVQGVTYMEGNVNSTLQKQTATFAAMWAGKNLNVQNNLKINKNSRMKTYISSL